MSQPHADRPLLGILLMLGFCAIVPIADAMAKLLGDYPLTQLVLIRFAAQAVLLLPLALWLRQRLFPNSRVLGLTLARTLLQMSGIGLMFTALRYLPLADAIAIAFVMPFIMLLLGWWVLNEDVGPRRLAACAVGFVGTLMVVQPSFAEVGLPALLPLAVAVIFALFMLVTRKVAKEIEPIALQGASALLALPILIPFAFLPVASDSPLTGWITPMGTDLGLFAILGFAGAVAHLLMTWSLRFAPSATLAPMQYLEIPLATLVGFLIFGDLPDGLAAWGIMVTIAAGLYIVWRERVLSRAAPPAA
ncbi:Membrane protein, putative [Roseibacterium elongatum DSM 19469]|uniref:Membrane protein, putative n=1 Tax=Roseicyclus elongatus DSM 19469 TaxID=1294273 RepID=W8SNM4_9RHOB|nr:DMT family transporter [Roseibacterium elongatum]AHM04140.1 Membrane protein, putative [Roseibacterium elongatum DSM 19469]